MLMRTSLFFLLASLSVVTIFDGQSVSLREGFAGREAVPVPALKGRERGKWATAGSFHTGV